MEGYLKHTTRDISFNLVVDIFGIKYKRRDNVDHLINSLEKKYIMKVDMDAKQYMGISTLDWNYNQRKLICSMDKRIASALEEFQHESPKQHYWVPLKAEHPDYVAMVQYTQIDDSKPLDASQIKWCQKVVGKTLLWPTKQ